MIEQLRPACVELSSIGLKFRADLASSRDVLKAVEPLHSVLVEVSSKYGLDEKLAEYAFFPLSHIFNETQRVSVRCLELAVRCLQILIEKGWRKNLSVPLGKQLLILLTIMAGGTPNQNRNQGQQKPDSEELITAAFDCIGSVCQVLDGPTAASAIFNEVGTSTVIDQTVYVLLEGVMDGSSDKVQLAAATALRALNARITHRVVLASLLPRSVSTLTKVLRPTTQTRRSYRVLCCCLETLREMLQAVLNDNDVSAAQAQGGAEKQESSNTIVLDGSWLNATASQVKLALGNVIRLRTHERPDVRQYLLELCLMVIERCTKSLSDSLSMMVETLVVLAEYDSQNAAIDAYVALKHLAVSSSPVLDILKSNMYTWVIALPRMMQSNNDAAKQRAIRQISTAFQVLSQTQPSSNIVDDTLATSLCDSVSAAIQTASTAPQPLPSSSVAGSELSISGEESQFASFQPVLLEHRSQQKTLSELQSMISKLSATDTSLSMATSLLKKVYGSSGDGIVAPFWLTLSFVKSIPADVVSLDDMLNLDITSPSGSAIIEELYSISLPLLTDLSTANPPDWRVTALALEAVALQAQQLGETFRPELIDALYPVLQLMGSSNPNMRNHAVTCLNILTAACNYPNASTMLVDNVDYLVNSVSLKLNTFDISPQAPQVLLMMVKLCGAGLIPYLDDLVGSIFAVLDAFHGYPKLVELLFSVLGTIVDEGAKKPTQLAITGSDTKPVNHRKRPFATRSISDIANTFRERREKRARIDILENHENLERESHPKRPWASENEESTPMDEDKSDLGSETDGLPPPKEEEKPLSKSHNLLLNIVKSIPPHLSSPSPFLRRSLLAILTRALPILSHDENTFLPVINDLWPSVSARITLPSTLPSTSTALTTAPAIPGQTRNTASTIDETGIQEETFVTVASCSTISTMCTGAGDFMSSRLEHDFPRWKTLYLRSWERVRQDSERAAERQQQRQRQQERLNARTVSEMESLTLSNDKPAISPSTTSMSTTSRGTHPRAPPPPPNTKSFTPHNSLFQALTGLFTTMLSHVHLPADISDDICQCLGTAISFYQPDYYFTYAWRVESQGMGTGKGGEVDGAIRAMDAWNADLTWFIFEKGRRGIEGGGEDRLELVKERIDKRIEQMRRRCDPGSQGQGQKQAGLDFVGSGGGDGNGNENGNENGRWRFSKLVRVI
ncbi:hypothetical protein AJ79_03812 [Helicocarpus griseus UAMH5409]|uniref:HEAT repeat protein n=1 Tax=Helicocarpus griseus UAMH5409 TaxID=1447875 RepID=A0A2B7XWT6_9EURO|nr:hypothetical protein AJ79_03812 [Helicocarpus griseus UAMH5409]